MFSIPCLLMITISMSFFSEIKNGPGMNLAFYVTDMCMLVSL